MGTRFQRGSASWLQGITYYKTEPGIKYYPCILLLVLVLIRCTLYFYTVLPRYYYKIEQSRTCIEKIKAFFRTLLTFMFTQVGVVVLVVTYMIIGALIFEHLEGESQMEVAVEALEVTKTFNFSGSITFCSLS